MNRISRITSTLALASLVSVFAPAVASASSPLLSGYGGPGGGEQAILGSTLIGGAGPGGSSGSRGSGHGGSSAATSGGASTGSAHATVPAGGSSATAAGGTSPGGVASPSGGSGSTSARGGAPHTGHNDGVSARGAAARAYVYPNSLRLASANSSVLDISNGDLLVLVATIATLSLVGVLTIRLGRLQH